MAGAGPEERLPGRRLWPSGHRDRDTEEIHLTSKPTQPVGCLGKGSGALQDTAPSLFPGPLSSCFGPRPGELEGTGRKPGSTLPHSPPQDHSSADRWLTNGCYLTIIHCGRGPMQNWPMAEQGH